MSVLAGRMRHRVEVQKATETENEFGELQRTFATIFTRWAWIEPVKGKESENADQVTAELTHKIRMRNVAGITAKHRIKFGTRIFEIAEPPIRPREIKERHILNCIELEKP